MTAASPGAMTATGDCCAFERADEKANNARATAAANTERAPGGLRLEVRYRNCRPARLIAAYCVVCTGVQVPFARSATVPGGQQVPQAVTSAGLQQTPFGVRTSLLAQGATHLPPTFTWPFGQGIPVSGIGQIEPVGLMLDLTGGTAASPVESQRQTSASGPDCAAACVPCGHWHE